MTRTIFGPLWRPGCATPVIAGLALSLAGCGDQPQNASVRWVQPSQPIYYAPAPYQPRQVDPPTDWSRRFNPVPPADAAPAPRPWTVPQSPQPVTEEPSPVHPGPIAEERRPELAPLRPVAPPGLHPVDPSCGWWRLCNFWSDPI